MKQFKLLLVIALLAVFNKATFGQVSEPKDTSDCTTTTLGNSNISFDLGADLVTRYVWRGTQYGGNGPSIQPNICFNWKGFSLGFWGAYSTNGTNSSQELDLYLSYTFWKDMLTIGFTDYFFTNDSLHEDPLNFKQNATGHIFEPTLTFNGSDKIPFRLMLAANVFGHDAYRINNDPTSDKFNKDDGIQYSSYLEVGYFTTIKDIDLDVFLGVNLTSPRGEDKTIFPVGDPTNFYMGESGFYGNKAGVVNLGFTIARELQITEKYALPLSASIILNPMSEDYYFVFGFSF